MRHVKFLATTIAIMAAVVSCQKYEKDEIVETHAVTSLNAYAPGHGNDSPDTRIALFENEAGGIQAAWMVYDAISLFDATSKMKVGDYYVSAIDETTGAATFEPIEGYDGSTPVLDSDSEYIAVYPAYYGAEDLAYRDEELNYLFGWYYGEMGLGWYGEMQYLDRACNMKSAPFKPSNPMSFAYEVAMMTIEFTVPDFTSAEFSDMQPMFILRQSFIKGEETCMDITLSYYCPDEFFSKKVKVHIMIPPTPEKITGERTVSLICGDPYMDDENLYTTLLTKTTTTPFEAGKRYVFE